MQETIDALPYQIAVIDQNGFIQYVNKAWQQFTLDNGGTVESTGPGVNYLAILENGSAKNDAQGLRAILNGEKTAYESKYPCHTPDELRWYYFHAQPLIQHGDITGAVVNHRLIGSEELNSRDIYQIIENMNDAMFTVDDKYRFTYINQQAESEMRFSRSELLGETMWEMFPGMPDSDFEQNYVHAMSKRVPAQFEALYPPSGNWYEVSIYPHDDGGLITFFRNKNKEKHVDSLLWQSQHFDPMTGLPNRRHIYRYMEDLITAAEPFCLFYFDLDHFQLINDVYGHDFGDEVMQEAASRLRWSLTEQMFLGRLGGDEFIIIAEPDALKQLTAKQSEKLSRLFDMPFYSPDGKPIQIHASISSAIHPEDGNSPSAMITAVDTAMHEAKKQRKDETIVAYQATMKEMMERRITIESDLLEHFDSGDYFLVYQPQVSLITETICGVEVLSRWHHPVYGMIPPPEFISVAESAGKSSRLTKKIIHAGLHAYQTWTNETGFNGKIAFNVSASMIANESFNHFLIDVKERYNIADGIIELEITENAQLTASQAIKQALTTLRSEGFLIAVDDFGTGFSSIDYLIDFPIDILKIDKTFIDQIGVSKRGESVLRSLISLGKSLELDIVVEGLETDRERRFLIEEGCTLAQGYYFDKPMTHDDLMRRFADYQQ
ncbi:EAL domain-containing protein [Salisediminibacterium halotolerans]|uniref:Two-component system, chemotaxis family, CheB/CheR fusion protein n=1 Tax=Salisediminibacterium halotolerans TaxID=517425 RepID=A0A1H9RHB3_9BACI|nr:EAL domain-containing protein [Salisediminibacterium haloalkalitolerans]SER71383.1 two-component system, chemotaxis family, CheB/CheR fusion protein [Salisediminibacterium haloalkalitolerans]